MNPLVWSPVHSLLEERVRGGDDIIIIIAPFVKINALKQLHWVQTSNRKIKIVCRWATGDLVSRTSDLEIYPYLVSKGCELYIHPTIHLKLYIFESNVAFNTSGNVTLRGLGYVDRSNIEVGNLVNLSPTDWANIYHIIEKSRRVDDVLYSKFVEYMKSHPEVSAAALPIDILGTSKAYTLSSLPATETPQRLAEYYFATSRDNYSPDEIRRAVHDLVTFGITPGLSDSDFDTKLRESFIATPFVKEFVTFLRVNRSLRFGAVNHWIQQQCEDVPLPYRWELKENTRIFYNWLTYYHAPEITWDAPRHSQIIYWNKQQSE